MQRQKIVDVLGIIILLGCIPWCSIAMKSSKLGLCVGMALLAACGVRIYFFRKIPKERRRVYDMKMFNWRLLGRDTIIHPYTQSVIIGLLMVANMEAIHLSKISL